MSGPSNFISVADDGEGFTQYDRVMLTIKRRWVLKHRLGRGTFGIVEKGIDNQTKTPVAIKIEPFLVETEEEQDDSHLKKEFKILSEIGGGIPDDETIGFPKAIYFASSDFMRVMVMELLGDTVMKRFSSYSVSLPEVYSVGIQVLNRLEHLHNCGFLHLDIKMDNILFGRGEGSSYVYLADFGLSERFREADGSHRPNAFRVYPTGTSAYNSINMSEGCTPSRRDDIETLGHVLIWFYFKTLPWLSPQAWHIRHMQRQPPGTIFLEEDNAEILYEEIPPSPGVDNFIGGLKQSYPIDRLCTGMPGMAEFMQHARGLDYVVRPDYTYLRTVLRRKMGQTSFEVPRTELI